jgi:uracil phosphoribosyltransferase
MSNTIVLDHPLVQHKISRLRDKSTGTKEFRELASELSMLMGYEVTRSLPLVDIDVETPVGVARRAKSLAGKKLCLLPVLRAGLGMVDGMLKLLPMAKVGHIGLYRDPNTLKPVDYYIKLPQDISERDVVILDPMLATAGTALAAVDALLARGLQETQIALACLIASKPGAQMLSSSRPLVRVYCCAVDDELNSHGYIVPGLGDAGDRLFGTK